MQTVVYRYPKVVSGTEGTIVTLGNFDGVHVGHSKLIDKTVTAAKDSNPRCASVVVNFYPHPSEVLGRVQHLPRITTLRQKHEILSQHNVDFLYLVHFTKELSKLTAAEFVDRVLIDKLRMRHLIVGPDATLGQGRQGDVAFLKQYLDKRGIGMSLVEFLSDGTSKVSSRGIRQLISEEKFSDAARCLGRHWRVDGLVRQGDKRGRQIGFPTANLWLADQICPPFGVYVSDVLLRGEKYQGITNVGIRPTFTSTRPTIETFLLNWPGGEFYGERIQVAFLAKLRSEQKFASLDELKAAISADVLNAKKFWTK